ncbi:hypothetical protein DITRI_Ditri04bG0045500 [Diplodiscus trichospermus]
MQRKKKRLRRGQQEVLSVELAIRRELAYRRKIEEMQLHQSDDSGDEIMAVQVETPRPDLNSSPRLSVREQLASLSNPECMPSLRLCQNPSSRPTIYSDPRISERKQLASSSSKSLSKQLQLPKGCNLNHQSLNFFCEVCQVPCSGTLNSKQHVNGKRHKVKLQELKFSRIGSDDTSAIENQKLC